MSSTPDENASGLSPERAEHVAVDSRNDLLHGAPETVASLNMRDADQFVLQRGRSTRLRPIHEARSAPNLGEFAQAEHVAKLLKQGESSHAKRLQLLKDCGVNLVRRVESNRLYEDESFRGDEVRVVLVVVLTVMVVVVVVVLVVVVVVVLVLVLVVVVVVVLVLVVVVVVLVLVLVVLVLVLVPLLLPVLPLLLLLQLPRPPADSPACRTSSGSSATAAPAPTAGAGTGGGGRAQPRCGRARYWRATAATTAPATAAGGSRR